MPSVEDLNVRSEWVAHEFRVLARHNGWLVKKVGVESIFANRKGILQYLQYEFTPIGLLLRSQPDMILRANYGLEIIEAKAVEDAWANVAIEAWQFTYLYELCKDFGVNTQYVFGWPDNEKLVGVIASVIDLPIIRFYRPPRFNRWPNMLRESLSQRISYYYPNIEIKNLEDGHGGSGDPYFVFPKSSLLGFQTITQWFMGKGQQDFNPSARISWEGKEEANRVWKSWTWSEWQTTHKREMVKAQ